MVLEIATFTIKETEIVAFKTACDKAKKVVSKAQGFKSLNFTQCIETPTKFVVCINWQNLEDHTVSFRTSDLFTQWKAILSPHFKDSPVAEHFTSFSTI